MKIVNDIKELERYNWHCLYTQDRNLCKKLSISYEDYKKILFI